MTGQGPDTDRIGLADQPLGTLSPREAARIAQVGRSSIMRAITGGELPAWRDNRNQWQIAPEALDRWRAARLDHDQAPDRIMSMGPDRIPDRAGPDPLSALARDLSEARAQAADACREIAQLQARLDERAALVRATEARAEAAEDRTRAVELDRDRWRAMAERLAERPAPPADPPSPPRRAWRWPWS